MINRLLFGILQISMIPSTLHMQDVISHDERPWSMLLVALGRQGNYAGCVPELDRMSAVLN